MCCGRSLRRGYSARKELAYTLWKREPSKFQPEMPFMYTRWFMRYGTRCKDAYPELKESADRVAKVVEAEERQFARVLEVRARGSLMRDFEAGH
jgi:alanyl-tRNA synthetase